MTRRGFIGAAVASAVATLVLAGNAQAALTTDFSDGTLRVFSNVEAEINNVSVAFTDDGFVVTESSANAVDGFCNVQGNAIQFDTCPLPPGGTPVILFDLGGGTDLLNVGDPRLLLFVSALEFRASMGAGEDLVSSYVPIDAEMGPDDDRAATAFFRNSLQGGPGDDQLEAGGGDDVVSGGPGNDRIWGGLREEDPEFDIGDGSDRLLGGSGRDKLSAKDATKDRKLDCGGGNDRLKRDSFDPRPKSC